MIRPGMTTGLAVILMRWNNVAKLPYMQFYPADYQADVRCLSLAAQGAWMNILCTLWRSPRRGQRVLPLEGWANEIGRPASEIKLLLIEIDNCGICDMEREDDDKIFIKCRRMVREERARQLDRKRKQEQRHKVLSGSCPVDVPQMSTGEVRSHISEVRSQKSEEEKREGVEATPPPSKPLKVSRPTRGKTAFPEEWKPTTEELDPWRKFGLNPQLEFASFRDSARSKDRRYADWPAAFRNWCRKSIEIKENGGKWTA